MMSIINLERERDYRSKILEKDSLISWHITYWFLKMFGTDKWEKLSLLPNSKKKTYESTIHTLQKSSYTNK